MDSSAVMVIHGGGVYGNKPEALKTFEENFMRLKESTRNRLVLENDEMVTPSNPSVFCKLIMMKFLHYSLHRLTRSKICYQRARS